MMIGDVMSVPVDLGNCRFGMTISLRRCSRCKCRCRCIYVIMTLMDIGRVPRVMFGTVHRELLSRARLRDCGLLLLLLMVLMLLLMLLLVLLVRGSGFCRSSDGSLGRFSSEFRGVGKCGKCRRCGRRWRCCRKCSKCGKCRLILLRVLVGEG